MILMEKNVIIEKSWAMPNGNTFTIKPIKDFVEKEIKKDDIIIDPFANNCKYGTITNDLNPEYNTTYHMDALEFLRMMKDNSADIVLYDPPYSITQASVLYKEYGKDKLKINVSNMKYWKLCKNNIARILKPNGKVICCGWNTNGLGKNRGFIMDKILIVSHGASRNDTLVTLEHKIMDGFYGLEQ